MRQIIARRFILIAVIALGRAAMATCVDVPPGLVLWLPGDGDTVERVSGVNAAGSGVQFASGVVDLAFSFDGIDDELQVADTPALDIVGDYTIEFWVNPSTAQQCYAEILRKEDPITQNNGFGVEMSCTPSSNDYFAGWKDGSLPDETSRQCWEEEPIHFVTNSWQHVAVVKSDATRFVYVDGQLVSSATCVGTNSAVATNDAPLRIGFWDHEPDRHWGGLLDEVSIYNRALESVEISALFNAGAAGKCKDDDGDGVQDEDEACFCLDTQVGVPVTAVGCSIEQVCPCVAPNGRVGWRKPSEYLRCLKEVTRELVSGGRISADDRRTIIRAGRLSGCGD